MKETIVWLLPLANYKIMQQSSVDKVSLADSTHALSLFCPGVKLGETGYKPIEMGFGRGQAIQVIEFKHALLPHVPLKIWWERSRVGSIPTLGTNHFLANQILATFRNF